MRRTVWVPALTLTAGILLGVIASQTLNAQQAPLKVALLLQTDVVGMEGKDQRIRSPGDKRETLSPRPRGGVYP